VFLFNFLPPGGVFKVRFMVKEGNEEEIKESVGAWLSVES
jgi:hypothetical protein